MVPVVLNVITLCSQTFQLIFHHLFCHRQRGSWPTTPINLGRKMPARDAATTAGSASPPPTFRHSSFLSSIPSPWDALRSPTSVISTESENGQGVSTERGPGELGSPGRDRRTPPFLGAPFWHNPPATATAGANTRHSVSGLPLIMSSV